MKHPWLAYLIVAILAVGAGVAVAGFPPNAPADATIVSPAAAVPQTTFALPATTEAPAATAGPSTEVITPTEVTTTLVVATTTTTVPLPDRNEVVAATANGSGLQGSALRVADFLETLGYVDVSRYNGTDLVDLTVVYFADGYDQAAARMAADLDLLPEFIAPIAEAPLVVDLGLVHLLAYVGLDRG